MLSPLAHLFLVMLAFAQQQEPATSTDELARELYRQESALAEWKLRTTVDAEVRWLVFAIEDLEQTAGQLALGAPRNPEVVGHLAAVNAAHLRMLVERGLLAAAVEQYRDLRNLAALEAEYPARVLSDAARTALSLDGMDAVLARIPLAVQEAATDPRTRSSEEVVIAGAVREAVQRGEEKFVRDLGSRALPTLRDLALQMGPTPSEGHAEKALRYLAGIDRPAALDLCLEVARRPSFLVRKRVLEALISEQVLDHESVWTPDEPGIWTLARPEWLELFELLKAEPGVAPAELGRLVTSCLMRGYVPPPIDRLVTEVGSGALPRSTRPSPALAPVATRLLDDPRDDVRLWAVQTLYYTPEPSAITALARLAQDPSRKIREQVVQGLRHRPAHVWLGHDRGDAGFRPVVVAPERNTLTRKAFVALLGDETKEIAGNALAALADLEQHGVHLFDVDELLQLTSEVAEDQARTWMLSLALERGSDDEDALTVERALADPSPKVRGLAFYWPVNGAFAQHAPTLYWATIERSRGHDAFSTQRALSTAMSFAEDDVAWRRATLDWLTKMGSDEDWSFAAWGESRRDAPAAWVESFDDASRVQLLRGVAPRFPERALRLEAWRPKEDAGPWRAAVLDETNHPLVRLLAASPTMALEPADAALVAAIVDAVLGVTETIDRAQLARMVDGLDEQLTRTGVEPLELTLALLARQDIQRDFRPYLRPDVSAASPERQRALARALVRCYPPASWPRLPSPKLVGKGVLTARHLPLDEQLVALDAATHVEGGVRGMAFLLVAETRDPRLLEVLRRYVRSGQRDGLEEAAQAAAGFLSDEAAEVILEAAAAAYDPGTRAAILASLDQISAYQDARARWQRRSDATARRVEAIAALVGLADDAAQPVEVRAEALRGLALLEAVEELPRLVAALAAEEAPIREAARAALARLNAPAPAAGATGDERD